MKQLVFLFIVTSVLPLLKINAQNVGVGVTNPQQKLHVGGKLRVDSLSGNGNGIITTDSNGDLSRINLTGNPADVLRGNGTFGSLQTEGNLPVGAIVGSEYSNNPALLADGFSFYGELTTAITTYAVMPTQVSEAFTQFPTYVTGDPQKQEAPEERSEHATVWTGTNLLIVGGMNFKGVKYNFLGDANKYNPNTDTWSPVSTVNSLGKRAFHSVAWNGVEAFFWGGIDSIGGTNSAIYFGNKNTGKRYNPATDTWTSMSVAGAPTPRFGHQAIMAGNYMVVWGGTDGFNSFSNGGRYNVATNLWSSMSIVNAPLADGSRDRLFWTGTYVVVLGNGTSVGRYNPATNTWIASAGCPATTYYNKSTAVWTGSEVWVYDDKKMYKYSPSSNSWTTVNITGTTFPPGFSIGGINAAVWTDTEVMYSVSDIDATGKFTGNRFYRYQPGSNWFTYDDVAYSDAVTAGASFIKAGSMIVRWGGSMHIDSYDQDYFRYSRQGIRYYLTSGIPVPTFYLAYPDNNRLYLFKKN